MQLLENLNWRYATKKFNPTKKVSEENLAKLQEAIRLSPSSYGLQLYKVLILENTQLREKLKPVSWGQSQITEASHLFVFCNYSEVKPGQVDEFIKRTTQIRHLPVEELKNYGDWMKEKISQKSPAEQNNWTAKQTYLALGNLLSACAELGIDACPMEGFEVNAYNEILHLTDQGLNAAVLAAIGYRSDEDPNQYFPKVRKLIHDLVEIR
jgi:nitroreductase